MFLHTPNNGIHWSRVIEGLFDEIRKLQQVPQSDPDWKLRNSEARILLAIATSLQRGIT